MDDGGDRIPPQDMDSESRVIASVLEDEFAFDIVADRLKSEHFYSDANRIVFKTMEELREAGDEITLPSVVAWLTDSGNLERVGGERFVEQIYNETPALLDPDREAARIIDRYRLREAQVRARRFVAEAYITPVTGADELMAELVTDVSELTVESAVGQESIMRDAVKEYAKKFEERAKQVKILQEKGLPLVEITTGVDRLDKLIAGLHRGNMTVVAARPGMGKSAMGLKFAMSPAGKNNYDGKPMASAFFSLEMPKDQLVMRATCVDGRIDLQKVRDLTLPEKEWPKYFKSLNDVAKVPMYIVDGVTRFSDIQSRIRKLKLRAEKEGFELTVVVIDYLQLIDEKQSGKQTRENVVSDISRKCKTLAKNCDVALVVLAQLNRDCEQTKDKRPKLHNLRESGSIEQDADEVIFLYRSDYYLEKEWEAKRQDGGVTGDFTPNNQIEVDVSKQRNGPTGRVLARWSKQYTGIDNLADEEYPN